MVPSPGLVDTDIALRRKAACPSTAPAREESVEARAWCSEGSACTTCRVLNEIGRGEPYEPQGQR